MTEPHFPNGDDWARTDPAAAGWDAGALGAFVHWIGDTNGQQLLVLDHGRIVAENNWGDPQPLDIASAQKSVVSVVVGILIARGVLDLDAPMSTWLGDGWTKADPAQEQQITLRHALSMTSGLYEDFTYECPAGAAWYYNNNCYHQVRKAIERATSKTTQEVHAELVFEPLGMHESEWRERPKAKDPHGWPLSGLITTARDLGRFALAVLAAGRVDGVDLGIDPDYLAAWTEPSSDLNPSYGLLWWLPSQPRALTPGRAPGQEPDPRKPFGGIELDRPIASRAPTGVVSASGFGDQRIVLLPDRQIAVVRLGTAAGERTAAAGPFDNELFNRLMEAAP